MKKFLIFFFLASCASPNSNLESNAKKLDFNADLNFEDFNELLIEYAKTSSYPNIDK
jgi:hypothetical protein|tara:strand:+ start:1010 stop:1180 length:171 start_codon:yes stop_codon:yes gene_type:complete